MKIGTRIRVNKGRIERLVKKDGVLGLFKSKRYQVVRKIYSIAGKEIII